VLSYRSRRAYEPSGLNKGRVVWARIITFDAEVNAEVPAVPLQWNATVPENIRGKEIKGAR